MIVLQNIPVEKKALKDACLNKKSASSRYVMALGKIRSYYERYVESKGTYGEPGYVRGHYMKLGDHLPTIYQLIKRDDIKVQEIVVEIPNSVFENKRTWVDSEGKVHRWASTVEHGDEILKYARPFMARKGRTILGRALWRKTTHTPDTLPPVARWYVHWQHFLNWMFNFKRRLTGKEIVQFLEDHRWVRIAYVTKKRKRY